MSNSSALPVARQAARPSKHRLASIMIIAVYPFITGLLYALTPFTEGWQTWQRTLVITPIMVLTIIFVISPTLFRHFWHFIHAMPKGAAK
jgi:antibiotic biosynthesis monooxygenase (ABM) superfamily enzyme